MNQTKIIPRNKKNIAEHSLKMYKNTMHADSSRVEIRLFNTSRRDKFAQLDKGN